MKFLTYKTNVSLYVGDQLLFFDLVEFLRRFPLRLGPTMFTSTKGRNIPKNKIERALIHCFVSTDIHAVWSLWYRYHTTFVSLKDIAWQESHNLLLVKRLFNSYKLINLKDCAARQKECLQQQGHINRWVPQDVHLYIGKMCFFERLRVILEVNFWYGNKNEQNDCT